MRWFSMDEGDDELGVLEVGDELELVALTLGGGWVLWVWRDQWAGGLWFPEVARA